MFEFIRTLLELALIAGLIYIIFFIYFMGLKKKSYSENITTKNAAKQERQFTTVLNQEFNVPKQTYLSKNEWAKKQQIKKEKGRNYEIYVSDFFKCLGYQVTDHGGQYGRSDGGIDLIAKKDEFVLLIQCKNWSVNSKYKITHSILKEFIGNSRMFVEKNPIYSEFTVKNIFITSEAILDKSALGFIKHNADFVDHQIIPFKELGL